MFKIIFSEIILKKKIFARATKFLARVKILARVGSLPKKEL